MRILTLIAIIFFSTSAFAQSEETSGVTSLVVRRGSLAESANVYASSAEAANAYVSSPVLQGLMDSMMSLEAMKSTVGLIGNGLSPDQVHAIAQIVSEELATTRPAMETAIITGMTKNFTVEEISAWNEFFSSPVGASAMRKMTPFMDNTMRALRPDFAKFQGNIGRRIITEMMN